VGKTTDVHRQPGKTGGNDLIGGKRIGRLWFRTTLEAEMDNRAEGQEFRKTRAISALDWPTPEMLTAAHRLRAKALKEMAAQFGRWLKVLVAERLLVVSPGRSRPRPAKMRVAHRR
jgi:hypothetical protein